MEHWFSPILSTGANISNAYIALSTDKATPFKVYIYDGNALIDIVTISKATPLEYNLGLGGHMLAVYTSFVGDTMKPLDTGIHLVGEKVFMLILNMQEQTRK